MSKVGDWVIEMQDDCVYLTREQFSQKHGERYVYIWDELGATNCNLYDKMGS